MLISLTVILVVVVFNRFHFSHDLPLGLGRLQSSDQRVSDFHADKPQIIGHRGCGLSHHDRPPYIGNTRNAIQRGIREGVDWVEIDIRRSKDGHLVVFHDESIDEKTNRTGKVANLDLQSLKEADVIVDPHEKILTLDEVFSEFYPKQRQWIFDIKASGIQKQVLNWLDERNGKRPSRDQVILFGTYDVLQEYKDQGYRLGYTLTWGKLSNRLRVLFHPGSILDHCENLDCHYLVLPIIFANDSLVDKAKEKGIDVWIYGSDNVQDHDDSAKRGITGLIVDRPADAVKNFAE